MLDEVSAGRWLRQQREELIGRWQGPLGVPAGSVVLCLGVGSSPDDLAAELLVRLLRAEKLDARHFSAREVDSGLPAGADSDGVSIAFLTSAFPSPERELSAALSRSSGALPSSPSSQSVLPGRGRSARGTLDQCLCGAHNRLSRACGRALSLPPATAPREQYADNFHVGRCLRVVHSKGAAISWGDTPILGKSPDPTSLLECYPCLRNNPLPMWPVRTHKDSWAR